MDFSRAPEPVQRDAQRFTLADYDYESDASGSRVARGPLAADFCGQHGQRIRATVDPLSNSDMVSTIEGSFCRRDRTDLYASPRRINRHTAVISSPPGLPLTLPTQYPHQHQAAGLHAPSLQRTLKAHYHDHSHQQPRFRSILRRFPLLPSCHPQGHTLNSHHMTTQRSLGLTTRTPILNLYPQLHRTCQMIRWTGEHRVTHPTS